ncbi:TlpA family protein disulfide reductase [Sphingobacterium lumbrici]|uniref:TlpA family protein disulfide reductase n=1 Tax=Sphingobacterium lumbrici TaxID=2559600 RepID=UPI0015E2A703|nr:TlpA disulfide reductase family protein [Sphingobacterium lumbrici]
MSQDFSVGLEERIGLGKIGDVVHPLSKANPLLLKKFRYNTTNKGDTSSLFFITFSNDNTHISYLKDSLFVLMTADSVSNRKICIDEDFDFDFTNNVVHRFTPETSSYPIVPIRRRQTVNSDTSISYIPYQLRAFDNRVTIRGVKPEYTFTEAWYKEGYFIVDGKEYTVRLKEYLLDREGRRKVSFVFKEIRDSLQAAGMYYVGDTVIVDRGRYKVELDGNKLKFIYTGRYSALAPDFQRQDLITGRNVQLIDFQGKYTLLDFWGSWCQPCVESIPALKNLAAAYSDKFEIVSIAFDKDADVPKLKSLIKKHDMNWHHIREPWEFNNYNNLIKKYDIRAYPTFILIDREGQIILKVIGFEGFSKLKDKLSEIFDL